MSDRPMLLIDVSDISPEGLDVDEPLRPGEVHIEGEEGFSLESGGRLVCHLDRGEEEQVQVHGRLAAGLGLTCGRCLEPFRLDVDQSLDLLYLPHRAEDEGREEEDEVELDDHEMVVAYYRERRLDLGEMVREQLFLAVPMRRLCREDCLGLCPTCGANRNLAPCSCAPQEPDTRLAPLRTLFDKRSS